MTPLAIRNAEIINEGRKFFSDILVENGIIKKIDKEITRNGKCTEIDATGLTLIPGVIDDQVHFREPGLTHKGTIYSESKAAVSGGITSFMEMPNTIPNTLTQELLEEKYAIASKTSWANFSFFMGASNTNLAEVLKTNGKNVCGIKVFMGSSTGDMLVDNEKTLEALFSTSPLLIATHCEDEQTIRNNLVVYKKLYNDEIPVKYHPMIRSEEACYKSSSFAVALAKKHNTRLHILHISTGKEITLFENKTELAKKKITAEACIHHLWFCEDDYEKFGNLIKWNPAIKTRADRSYVFNAVLDNYIDIIATDHAPHTLEEKNQPYTKAPSGGPLVQHGLLAMFELYHQGKMASERIVEKMCHAPAVCFQVSNRGFIREGYCADLVLLDLNKPYTVNDENIVAKCGWSPFNGTTFNSSVVYTLINGNVVYHDGAFFETSRGERLLFNRN